MPSQPLASQRKFGAAAKAKSRTESAVKRQVTARGAPAAGGAAASSAVMIAMAVSLVRARARRSRCCLERTSDAFRRTPVPATT
jgi:hypothetical protein